MKAVIMAGGEGTRLRPLTSNMPKPMVPMANRPMMEHIVELLKSHGFDEIVVTLAFMPSVIRDWFGDGSEFGVRMVYAVEESPLGTAGSVRNAIDELDDTFLVISGDVLTDIDLTKIVDFHKSNRAMATIGLVRVDNPPDFGIVITRDDGSVERFLEKPSWGQVFSDTINSGIFVLEPSVFDYIEPGRPVDFAGEVFPDLLERGEPIYGAIAEGYWEDVGTIESYVNAHADVLDGRVSLHIDGFEQRDRVFIGDNVVVHGDAVVEGPALLGDNCRIEQGARVGPYTVLGTNVRVRADADLERVVVADNTYLAEGVNLRGSVIGRSCDLRQGVRTEAGVVVGDECFVGAHASVGVGVKIYPFKTIESGATINSSIVWESKGSRSLFGPDGVRGLANVDITPEVVTKLAMAYGSTLKQGQIVVTSRDSSRSSRMLKRSIQAGLNASGISVQDLEVAPVPVARFVTRRPEIAGAVTVSLDASDPQSVVIGFIGSDGGDMSENDHRKIERLLHREDYRRVFPGEIGDLGYVPRALEHYSTAIESTVDVAELQSARLKLVADFGFSAVSFVMPNVMSKLGCEVLALNPFVSTAGAAEFDRMANSRRVAELVTASGAQVGVVFTPGGEQLTIVDDTGRILSDAQLLLAMISMRGDSLLGQRVVLPVSVTSRAAAIVEALGGTVVLTPTSSASVMKASAEPNTCLASDGRGRFVTPAFMPAFDAIATFVFLLSELSTSQRRLSEVVDAFPGVHMERRQVVTPWEQKGAVMRVLTEQAKGHPMDLVDGVRIHHDDEWILILPDPGEPVTLLIAEGESQQSAERLVTQYVRWVEEMITE